MVVKLVNQFLIFKNNMLEKQCTDEISLNTSLSENDIFKDDSTTQKPVLTEDFTK